MKEELEKAEALLKDIKGLAPVSKFCGKLANGKLTSYYVAQAHADFGYLQLSTSPSAQDYELAPDFPNLYLVKKEAEAVALKAAVAFLRETPLSVFWEGMCHEAIERQGLESVDKLTDSISKILERTFSGSDEFIAADATDEQLVEIINLTGYHCFRAKALKVSV